MRASVGLLVSAKATREQDVDLEYLAFYWRRTNRYSLRISGSNKLAAGVLCSRGNRAHLRDLHLVYAPRYAVICRLARSRGHAKSLANARVKRRVQTVRHRSRLSQQVHLDRLARQLLRIHYPLRRFGLGSDTFDGVQARADYARRLDGGRI